MADWIDLLGDVIFQVAGSLMDTSRPKRLVGIWLAAVVTFGTIGLLAAFLLGARLDPLGFYVFIPALMITAAIAGYCFLADR